ncbi:DUF6301 family protein [Nocardia sp. NPDC050697]|uniref:DUF6301 family protein n=1 Tax=Nocardia sp. NPDC050697 TaxID=3155158 RepID=UPI0033F27CA9
MRANTEAAIRISRTAAEYSWGQWPIADVDELAPFCALVGWRIGKNETNRWLETDLDPGSHTGLVHSWTGGVVGLSVTVTDVADPEHMSMALRPPTIDCFAELAEALTGTLGDAVEYRPGWEARIGWHLPRVGIQLTISPQSIQLGLVDPRRVTSPHTPEESR